jgi:hypothetical protein
MSLGSQDAERDVKGEEFAHSSENFDADSFVQSGKLSQVLRRSWTQILLVSFCCFCLPGMYNAISGMGGSGQLDPTVRRLSVARTQDFDVNMP